LDESVASMEITAILPLVIMHALTIIIMKSPSFLLCHNKISISQHSRQYQHDKQAKCEIEKNCITK
jgi:hypothetical protein